MSSPIVRRLTAVLALAAALWLAAPPAADAASRRAPARPQATLVSNLVDQLTAWLLGFWPAPAPTERNRQGKTGTIQMDVHNLSGVTNDETADTAPRGAMIDPNGGW
ncbi:MAG TPA: hypothetical protein VF789_13370 [Thermoanaerobaculia bacterium]